MAMLERAGEEHAFADHVLQLFAGGTEADNDGSRVNAPERLEQEADTLLLAELSHVRDRRLVGCEKGLEPLRIPLVRVPLRPTSAVPPGLLQKMLQRLFARLGPKLVHVNTGRDNTHPIGPAHDLG